MSAQNDPEGAPQEAKENKEPPKSLSKLVRVMTVFAYLSSVSMAAVLLSIYYLCIWKSPVLSDLDAEMAHQQGQSFEYQAGYVNNGSELYDSTGGSSTTINDSDVQLPPSSLAFLDDQGSSEVTDATVTEPITQSNTTMHHNGTTEATVVSTDEDSTIEKSTLAI